MGVPRGRTQTVTPALWHPLTNPWQATRLRDISVWFIWEKSILTGSHASRVRSPPLAGWGLCGGYSPSPGTQPPHLLLSVCPCCLGGYMERGDHRWKGSVCKEAVGCHTLRLGRQHPSLGGGAAVPSPRSPFLSFLPPRTQCPPFPCSLTLADLVMSIKLQFRADKRRMYGRVGGAGQGRKSTAQLTSLALKAPPGQLMTSSFQWCPELPKQLPAQAARLAAGCHSKSCPWGWGAESAAITSSFDLPSLLVMGLVSQASEDGSVGRAVPTQLSLLSCGTQASRFQGWPCSQKHYKMHMHP